jgi:hypothetical protein
VKQAADETAFLMLEGQRRNRERIKNDQENRRHMKNYQDKYGFVHHKKVENGDPETSENGPLYTGMALTENRLIIEDYRLKDLLARIYVGGTWRTTPVSPASAGFSHDNFKGLIAMILYFKKRDPKFFKKWRKRVPLFHRQLMHPRDFCLVGYFKYPLIFWPTLPIVWLTMFITCYQTYKVRNGVKYIKTDGKLMARMICIAFNWPVVLDFCTDILKRKDREVLKISWRHCFAIYFKDPDHPFNRGVL